MNDVPSPKQPFAPGNDQGTRERILRAAAEAFSRYGYCGAGLRDICKAAGANVASVKYYFGSKTDLYCEVFHWLFSHSGEHLPSGNPTAIVTAEEWEQALLDWTAAVLRAVTSEKPEDRWRTRLFWRERGQPSEVLPVILERFYRPILGYLEGLLRLGFPEDTPQGVIRRWAVSTMAQCTIYIQRDSPWDEYLFPETRDRDRWVALMARHITDSIVARLEFRGPASRTGRRGENGCLPGSRESEMGGIE